MAIKIDKGVPLDGVKRGRGRPALYPWKQMKCGDSFFVPHAITYSRGRTNGEVVLNPQQGRQSIPGSHWVTRTVIENGIKGVRVWRFV